jgi:serine protease AprX
LSYIWDGFKPWPAIQAAKIAVWRKAAFAHFSDSPKVLFKGVNVLLTRIVYYQAPAPPFVFSFLIVKPFVKFAPMRTFILLVISLSFCISTLYTQGPGNATPWRNKIAAPVWAALNENQVQDVLVVFKEQADLSGAFRIHGKIEKARFVYDRLVTTATQSQAGAIRLLRAQDAFFNSFHLVNAIAVDHAGPGLIEALAGLPEVARIAPDPAIPFQQPGRGPDPVTARGTIEWGIEKINAPAVWALGYTGQGITVAGADTGYEWAHPALKPHYRGYNKQDGSADHNYNWHDAIHEISPLSGDSIPDPANNPCGVNSTQPCDDHSHGTHTMGTMVGDDGQGNQIGVAPGADWIACRNMERGNGKPSSYIECFEWFMAPTDLNGQNADPAKAPHVINNSWYCSIGEGCTDISVNELMRQVVYNLRASGVVVVVSNGNFGSIGCNSTFGPPAYFEESFSVGATESNDTITGFSSRGPVLIDTSYRLKPNVVAPGAGIRSSVRYGGYAHYWGTSMAGPHVAGLVALVLSARPDLAGEVDLVEDLIEQSALPLFDTTACGSVSGQAHPNNTYGFGRADALAAVLKALTASPVSLAPEIPLEVRVYPNPLRQETVFSFPYLSGNNRIEIADAQGRLVFEYAWTASGAWRQPVSLANQPAGLYSWRIISDLGAASGKLVKW